MDIIAQTGRTIDIKLPKYENISEVDCTTKERLLKGILHNDKRLLWKGDAIYTEDLGWHRINMLKRIGPNHYRSTCMERTDTSMFLLPLFGGDQIKMCFPDYFMNAFLYHEQHGKQEGIIWVLIKKPLTSDVRYIELLNKFRGSNRCVKEEILSSTFTLFTMKLPDEHIKDYTMFSLSKFSKLSDKAKDAVFRFHGIIGQPDHQIRLQLTKSPIYKAYLEKKISDPKKPREKLPDNAELRSVIEENRETFKMSYITEDIR